MKVLLISSCALVLISTSSIVADPDFNPQHPASDPAPITAQHLSAGELPQGLSARDWSGIQAQIAAGPYRAYARKSEGFAAANPAHGWNIRYAADGTTTLQPRDPEATPYQLGFRLEAVGYAQPQPLDQPQQLRADDTTVTYQWTEDLREWWTNTEHGLEQWFELEHRPAGASDGQPLNLRLSLDTDLNPSLAGDTLKFIDADGTEITYSKLIAWDATGRDLPARMQLTADGLNLLIDEQDARYPLTIDPTLTQQAYLKGTNTEVADQFGNSLDLDGDTLVVGAHQEDSDGTSPANNTATVSGAAYVFVRSGTTWEQQAYLKASTVEGGDEFGVSVAIDGDTVVVGARYEDSDGSSEGNNSAIRAGAVYVFVRSGTTWAQQAYLKASNAGSTLSFGDQFGQSVAISGDTVVVGAPGEASANGDKNNNSAPGAGAAYVFTRSGTNWTEEAYLKPSVIGGNDAFGQSVAVDVDTVVVGALLEDSNAKGVGGDASNGDATDSGAAYVFTRSGTSWTQQAYLKASNTGSNDQFGQSVAISGDTALVGARREGSNATGVGGDELNDDATGAGAVYVFVRNTGVWAQEEYLKASNTTGEDQFGFSVALVGDTALVGANREGSDSTGVNGDETNDDAAANAGAAYMFVRNGTTWTQQAYLKASNTETDDKFGNAVSISGDTLVVGASSEDSIAGAVYVFAPPRRVIVISQ